MRLSCVLHWLCRVYAGQWGLNKGNPRKCFSDTPIAAFPPMKSRVKVSVRDKSQVNERPTPAQVLLNQESLQVQHKRAKA